MKKLLMFFSGIALIFAVLSSCAREDTPAAPDPEKTAAVMLTAAVVRRSGRMKSMTGYGSSETWYETFTVSVEIKSLNNRYLDIHLYTPSFLNPLDQEIRDIVKQEVVRGHVDVNVRIKQQESDVEVLSRRNSRETRADTFYRQ